jgi:hypothetical protein
VGTQNEVWDPTRHGCASDRRDSLIAPLKATQIELAACEVARTEAERTVERLKAQIEHNAQQSLTTWPDLLEDVLLEVQDPDIGWERIRRQTLGSFYEETIEAERRERDAQGHASPNLASQRLVTDYERESVQRWQQQHRQQASVSAFDNESAAITRYERAQAERAKQALDDARIAQAMQAQADEQARLAQRAG